MSDLIDRQETIKQFCKQDCGCDPKDCPDKTCYEVEIIESVPTHPTPSNTLGALDCVSRQDAIKFFTELWECIGTIGDREEWEDVCVTTVNEIKSVQPKKGKWIYGEHDVAMCDGYRCDNCGFFVPWDYQHKFIDFINEYNFCPNCGADMREGDAE